MFSWGLHKWLRSDFTGFRGGFAGFAAVSRVSRCYYELHNARTEVWGSGNQGEKILQPHEEGGGLLRGPHVTGAGPRCLEGGFAQDFAGFAGGFAVVSQVSQ